MFIQVVQGKVADAELLGRRMEAWQRDVKPGAQGYLGSTGGITPDGRLILLARFESEEAARANSERPEQGAWWSETAPAFDGEATFHDCPEVDLIGGGGSNDAGFVQVMQGRAKDQEEMRRRAREMEPQLEGSRPDVLGGVVAWHGDGSFTQAIYFTSEAAAREGEKSMQDDDVAAELMALIDGEMTFFDLPDPQLD